MYIRHYQKTDVFWKGRRNKVVREGDVCMMAVHDRSYLLFCFILVGVAVHVCMYTFASFDTLTHCTFHVCLVCLLVCSTIVCHYYWMICAILCCYNDTLYYSYMQEI